MAFSSDDVVNRDCLISACCGLVTLNTDSQIVRLIHYSAQGFLKNVDFGDGFHPHALIASACTSYPSFRVADHQFPYAQGLQEFLGTQPLLTYAYDYWGLYAQRYDSIGTTPDLVHLFVAETRSYPRREYHRDLNYLGLAHLAALFGLTGLLRQLRTHCCDTTPRELAWTRYSGQILAYLRRYISKCEGGFSDCTHACVSARARRSGYLLHSCDGVNMNGKDRRGQIPLILAFEEGQYEGVVELLLACDDIEVLRLRMCTRGVVKFWFPDLA